MLGHYHHFEQAVELTASNRHQEAIEEFTKALEQEPRHFPSLLNRGTIYGLLRLWPLAVDDFAHAIKLEPSDPVGYYNRFVAWAALLKYNLALQDLYCALSLLYVQRAVASQALKYFTRAISLVENNQFAHIERGEYYREGGKDKLALNQYCCALEIDPNNKRALSLRTILYRQLGQLEKAEKDHQMVLCLSQLNSPPVEPVVLRATLRETTATETLNEIHRRLQEYKELREQVPEKADRFSKSKSAVSFLKDADSTQKQRYESRNESESREQSISQSQSLSSKFAKILETKVVSQTAREGIDDNTSERKMTSNNPSSSNILADKSISNKSSKNESKDEESERAVLDHKSSRGSKKGSEIRKLADLIIDDEEFGATSLHQSRTPLSNLYESKSMTSRTLGTSSQVIRPSNKKHIEVELVAATITHNTELVGNMSPYCTVIYENEVKNTKVATRAGKNPVWNETFTFLIKDSTLIKFEVWDKETIKKDDFVGAGTISIDEPSSKCLLKHEGQLAGTVYLKLRLI